MRFRVQTKVPVRLEASILIPEGVLATLFACEHTFCGEVRISVTKSWMSGEKNTEAIEKLRAEITELERKRESLLEKGRKKVFDWSWFVLNSPNAPGTLEGLRSNAMSQEVKETIALYEQLNQEIMDKEASLGEKLDEQARNDSLA